MSSFLRTAILVTLTIAWGASTVDAQTVSMAGEYGEANGIIVNIPQNPPIVTCSPTNDARCPLRNQKFFGAGAGPVFSKPSVGVKGARIVTGGLNAGDAFVVPPFAFSQDLGLQVGIVLNNVVRQLDTTFVPAMPGTSRTKNPDALTRNFSVKAFSVANVNAHGQNNGLATTDPNYVYRQALTTTISRTIGAETLSLSYSGGGGFSGTMTSLLDGGGRLYLGGPNIDGLFPTSVQPVIGTNPVGSPANGIFRTRGGAGWDYTVTGSQASGKFKGFPGTISSMIPVVAPACAVTPPPTPAGCNEVNGFDTFGFTLAPLPGATSVKHMFAWTTGTVSIMVTAVRNAVTITETLTAMGYDTVGTTGGTAMNAQRNVGLVSGSYTTRTDGVPTTQLAAQMSGINLKFVPEPGSTIALMGGLGMLGVLIARRRR